MKIKENDDIFNSCNECLGREKYAQVIITIGGFSIKLCDNCRKEMMKRLIDKY